ncbi:hypothetical protein ACPS0O_11250 [Yersinia pestis]
MWITIAPFVEQQAQAEALQPTEESVMPKLVQPGPVYSENN